MGTGACCRRYARRRRERLCGATSEESLCEESALHFALLPLLIFQLNVALP